MVTKAICNKGFSGMRKSEVRFNFSCNLIGNLPKSLTALTLDRQTAQKPPSFPTHYFFKLSLKKPFFLLGCVR